MRYAGGELEWESKVMDEICLNAMNDVKEATTWEDFAERVSRNWIKIRGCCFHDYSGLEKFCDGHKWAYLKDLGKRDLMQGCKKLTIDPSDEAVGDTKLEDACNELYQLFDRYLEVSKARNAKTKTEEAFCAKEELWLAVYDIMKSRHVHTCNLFDIQNCKKKLISIAQIDRLPKENTLCGLILLRRAWTLIDLFTFYGLRYKKYTKISYFILVLIGIVTVVVTALNGIFPDMFTSEELKYIILGTSLSGGLVTGWTAIIDPNRKWMQLRGGALKLESEMWKFRTRTGDYRGSSSSMGSLGRTEAERDSERAFQEVILSVEDKVMQSSGLNLTTFYAIPTATDDIWIQPSVEEEDEKLLGIHKMTSVAGRAVNQLGDVTLDIPLGDREGMSHAKKYKPLLTMQHFKHKQYKDDSLGAQAAESTAKNLGVAASGRRPRPGEDNHHSPATPHEYVRWRLVPEMQFYQGRIPLYAYYQRIFRAGLLLTSIANALLASTSLSKWTAVIAAIASAIAAWQEFVGFAKKLERYSTVSESLQDVLMWWQSLRDVDHMNLKKVEQLVEITEGLLRSEHSAWLSDAQKAKKAMDKASGQKQEEQEADAAKKKNS
eukprot:gnl/TRDRNA2_/TRDRNA2_172372_c2_seq2.p1 gnl/TRDRNA2_/TRDRNA2_172372_c2~~gnl/TRDRNA2_/TRDRNA2_172372_c2_seq2.p1  ORF type:complete len:605 (-),score=110.03 gnl/TRDRNA2_/TRDRNA2_172372_c2_seq2:105-1919(-)